MHKRKISGLIKYGSRRSKPVRKLQEGGYVAYGAGYDWRDDPYEMRLLDMQAQEDANRIKYKAKKTAPKGDIGSFKALTGGLPAANQAANLEYNKVQDAYFNNLEANGVEWASSISGKRAYQQIVNTGVMLENRLKSDKTHFDEAWKQYEDPSDSGTLAVSASNEIMVMTKDGKIMEVGMEKYLENPKTMRALKVSDVAEFKRNRDTSMEPGLVNKYMINGALGSQSMYEEFIKPNEDMINSSIKNYMLKIYDDTSSKNAARTGQLQTNQGAKYMEQLKILLTQYGNANSAPDTVGMGQRQALEKTMLEIYGDAFQYSKGGSRLTASLHAEILDRDRAKIESFKTTEERTKYLTSASIKLFLDKVVYKGLKVAGESEGGGGDGGNSSKIHKLAVGEFDKVSGAIVSIWHSGNVSKYKVDSDLPGKDAERGAIGFSTLQIDGVLSTVDLDLPKGKKPSEESLKNTTLDTNKILDSYAFTDEIYLEDGRKASDLLPGSGDYQDFRTKGLAITPGSSVSIVYLPVDKAGKIVTADYRKVSPYSKATRQAFLEDMQTSQGLYKDIKPMDMYEGSGVIKRSGSSTIFGEYDKWLAAGANLSKSREDYENSPKTVEDKKLMASAEKANKVMVETQTAMAKILPGVKTMPFLKVNTLFNNDAIPLATVYEESNNGYAKESMRKLEKSGWLPFTKNVTNYDYMQHVMGSDTWGKEDIRQTFVFLRVKSEYAKANGVKARNVNQMAEIQEAANMSINANSLMSNVSMANVYSYLKI